MSCTYAPQHWVVGRVKDGYKLFTTISGGYLSGDSWRVNSGITGVTEYKENYYLFEGYSGSSYLCHKDGYGVSSFGIQIYGKLIKKGLIEVQDDCDWLEFDFKGSF